MDFHIVKGDKSMVENIHTQELSYKSTRETAKILQVSLGTIQKMVETGELIAWKTRGGHRRILDISIEHQLSKRRELLSHFCSKKYSILGIFNENEDIENFENHCRELESSIRCYSYTDISEALMAAVELKPEIIYVDQKINSIDQFHIVHQFHKNNTTGKIPLLIHQDAINELNVDNSGFINAPNLKTTAINPKIYKYSSSFNTLEVIIKKALLDKII